MADPSTFAKRCNTMVPTFGSSSRRRPPRPTVSERKPDSTARRSQLSSRLSGSAGRLRLHAWSAGNASHRPGATRQPRTVFTGILHDSGSLADLKAEPPFLIGVGLRPRRTTAHALDSHGSLRRSAVVEHDIAAQINTAAQRPAQRPRRLARRACGRVGRPRPRGTSAIPRRRRSRLLRPYGLEGDDDPDRQSSEATHPDALTHGSTPFR